MAVQVLRLSHISFHVSNSKRLARDLAHRFRFQLCGSRETGLARQLVLRNGSAVFLVNESPGGTCSELGSRDLLYDVAVAHAVDSACNVSFEVKDVERATLCLDRLGCRVLVPPRLVEDELGCVTYSVVRSVLGNVCHTLIDRSGYRGDFLPGFDPPPCPGDWAQQQQQQQAVGGPVAITHFDHITYVCPRRQSAHIMDWYRSCFGFQRLLVSRNEDVDEGYVIEETDIGLRLTCMEYWKCSEVGMSMPMTKEKKIDCKFVIAESLSYSGKNHVDTFLEHHHGAGIQHVGLYTTDIVSTCKSLKDAGVEFFSPPLVYYTETGKWQEIMKAGQDPELLSQYGVLLDTEVDDEFHEGEAECQGPAHKKRYLMQIFTKPIFAEDTLFLELIERKGALGFGGGNIRALWKCVQTCIDQQEDKKIVKEISARNGLASDVNS
ncbi:4-hydroxyphenylpyruvate dioxygenase-like protein [Heterodontus francisci]|uniref:4-hydroxyphenylpyruvate dioxygenase-like protein n=1 Tax=Heterodontus francisci TaxID=7792 RepID=UPI00355AEFAE